jgi:pseudaminic acid cytidylyltransferase
MTARDSGLFSHIFVSTDDDAIISVALDYGAVVPEKRPKELSDDWTPTAPVINHEVLQLEARGFEFEFACCIYPCTPLLTPRDIENGFRLLQETCADFVYPVVEYRHPVQRAMSRLESGKMVFLNPENELIRTQDLEKTYHDAGQFYWGTKNAWKAGKNMHSDGHGLVVPDWRMVDIDTSEDWRRAELLCEALKLGIGDEA